MQESCISLYLMKKKKVGPKPLQAMTLRFKPLKTEKKTTLEQKLAVRKISCQENKPLSPCHLSQPSPFSNLLHCNKGKIPESCVFPVFLN
jgi:hypothetical protein